MTERTERSLAEQLARLLRLDRQQLADLWRDLYHIEPPIKIGAEFLRMACAYRLQESEHGGLKPATQRYLMKVAEEVAAGKPGITPPLVMKPGTRLIREWHGVTYEVIIIPGGVLLNGEQLKSLTEAAHRITGAKWSGPRFFGLVRHSAITNSFL